MKKNYFTLLVLLLVWQLSKAQSTETFESYTVTTSKPTTFTNGGQPFTLTTNDCTNGGTFAIYIPNQTYTLCGNGSGNGATSTGSGYGVGTSCTGGVCTGTSNNFIDNGTSSGTNQTYSIKTTNSALFTIKSLYVYVSTNSGGAPATAGVIFTGFKGGVGVFTVTISSGLNTSSGTNNGFTYIDFSSGSNSNKNIDQLQITGSSSENYIAIDNFTWGAAVANLTATTSHTNIACNGSSTGAASVAVSGGTPSYLYSWAPSGGTGATATGLAAGNYTCTITDAASSVLTETFTITQPTSGLSAITGSTAVSCFGGSNGVANVNVSGGTPSYSYAWSPSGGTGATASGLAAGNYTCTITDANSCTLTKVAVVHQPSSGLSATTSSTAVSCFGGSNGVASVNVSGGTASYSYAWSPSGGTGATASGLGAGNYTCTITDANSCSITKVVAVGQPTSGLSATTGSTAVSCFGGSNGAASVNVSGGTISYSYSWSPSGGTAATASGLTAGNYTCTITDANSCSFTKVVKVGQPTSGLIASTNAGTISCNGGITTVTVSATGGTSSYTGTGTFTVSAGTYSYTVTDANSCSATTSLTVNQPTILAPASSAGTISCNGGITTVTVSVTGGTSSYTGTGTFTVSAGTYSYTVTDANSCSATTSLTVNQPAAISSSQQHSVCAGGSFVVGAHTYTATGAYIDVLTSVHGCDSTVTTNLTVQNAIDISTSVSSQTVTANQNGAAYQWIDCGNVNSPVTGATNQSYVATSGSYAVIITLNGCVNTSTCVTIASTGIHSISSSTDVLNVYPNPNNGAFTISSKTESAFMLVNELGQTIQTFRLNASTNFETSIQGLSSGIYYIVGSNNTTSVRKKIIVTQ